MNSCIQYIPFGFKLSTNSITSSVSENTYKYRIETSRSKSRISRNKIVTEIFEQGKIVAELVILNFKRIQCEIMSKWQLVKIS